MPMYRAPQVLYKYNLSGVLQFHTGYETSGTLIHTVEETLQDNRL